MKQQQPARKNPSVAPPMLQRALQLHQAGRLGQAEHVYRTILATQANHFDALHLLGVVRHQQGRNVEALHYIGAALKLRPGSAAALNNFGLVLAKLRRPEEALASYDRALALKPDYVEALNNRGDALRGLKRFEEALASYDRAIARKSDYAEAFNGRGSAFVDLRRLVEALASYDRALGFKPRFSEALSNRGRALAALERPHEALASYAQAIAVNPDLAEAHEGQGLTLLDLGHLEEASKSIERAIERAPGNPRLYYNLGQTRRFSRDDPQLAAMERLARDMPSLGEDEQIELNFAIGNALADIGEAERSFRFLLDGNALRRRQLVYNESVSLGILERTRATFTADRMRRGAGQSAASSVPIFVVGMPRSGTTLIEQILASHPEVFGAGEIDDFDDAIRTLDGDAAHALHSPEIACRLSDAQLRELAASYLGRIEARAPAATRIVNKMPKNFRHAGLIHLALPNARIIHARRDPVDTCVSCFSKMFTDNLPYTFDLGELGRYHRACQALMAHWRAVLGPTVMLDVQYEELVGDLEGQARRIVAHCGLEWDPRCLAFHQTERPVRTASATQVRQPVYTSSVGRGRAYERFLAPLLAALAPPVDTTIADLARPCEPRASF
jgi:tetratricopeptide (TPR) repeat protein